MNNEICCHCDLPLSLDRDSSGNSHWNAWTCLRLAKAEIGRLTAELGDARIAANRRTVVAYLAKRDDGITSLHKRQWEAEARNGSVFPLVVHPDSPDIVPGERVATAQRHGEGV